MKVFAVLVLVAGFLGFSTFAFNKVENSDGEKHRKKINSQEQRIEILLESIELKNNQIAKQSKMIGELVTQLHSKGTDATETAETATEEMGPPSPQEPVVATEINDESTDGL